MSHPEQHKIDMLSELNAARERRKSPAVRYTQESRAIQPSACNVIAAVGLGILAAIADPFGCPSGRSVWFYD